MPRKRKPESLIVRFWRNGKRRTISLRSYRAKDVEAVNGYVQRIVKSLAAGRDFDSDVCAWLWAVSDELHAKLVKVGLAEPRKSAADHAGAKLGPFLVSYIAKRVDAKPSSRLVFTRAQKHLIEFFGADRALASITEGAAEDFPLHLSGKKMAEATIRKMCGVARQFFKSAVKHRLIAANPFDAEGIKTTVKENAARFRFVTADEAVAVLKACPDAQWRLIFALSRWGGLRCPSEHLALRWEHVDWANNRLIVPQPKVAHHGTPERAIPIFPELRPHLDEAFDAAPAGEVWVITRYRKPTVNMRTQFERIIRKAGLVAWPRLFHNLRATRQTELSDRFPQHVVCQWLGNSEAVARRHYLNVLDSHFVQAATSPTVPAGPRAPKALHSAAILSNQGGPEPGDETEKPLISQGLAERDGSRGVNQWTIQDSNL